MTAHPAVPKPAATLAALLDEMRTLAAHESPQRAAVARAFVAAANIMKHEPREAPVILRKSLPLVMHAMTHVQRGAADGLLKLLDLAAALPDDVVDEAMPVLAQLLDFSIGKWSFSQSTYRFARFAPLRQRILDAALEMAVAERNHTNPGVAVMALSDVIGGLQKCNAFDEPQVAEAFARYALGQSNSDVQRAVVAYLLEPAPHVVARVLETNPDLFPSIEDISVYRSEQYHHLVDPGPHEARVAGLAQVPVANLELFLLDEGAHVGRRMAAALAVPHLDDKAMHARFLPVLRRMLDEDSRHIGIIEGQTNQPEHFWTRVVALASLTKVLASIDDPALALDTLRAAAPRQDFAALLPLARLCQRDDAIASLTTVAANDNEPGVAATFSGAGRWNAFRVLCELTTGVDRAAQSIARDVDAPVLDEGPGDLGLMHALFMYLPDLVTTLTPRAPIDANPLAPLLSAWVRAHARVDVSPLTRHGSYKKMKESKYAASVTPFVDEARRVLQETAKLDKPLAEALLIAPL